MASRKSSILKPRRAREPLQDLNLQLLPNNDDEETTVTTGLAKRRVSFASMNKVKEFESAAECVTLLNTPAYDERFSISSDSCHSSVLSSSHTDPQKVVTKSGSIRDDVAAEEEIELTETVGGKIYESAIKSCVDSSMEYTTPCPTNIRQSQKIIPHEIMNHENIDCDTSCMETTEVITNNMYSATLISQMCTDGEYDEETVASECQNMEISPYREVQPVTRKSIFHNDQYIPARKSIFHPATSQSALDFVEKDNLYKNGTATEENIMVDMSLVTMEESEEKSLPRMSINRTFGSVQDEPRRSIFQPALNLMKPEILQSAVPVVCHLFEKPVEELETQDIGVGELETQNVETNQLTSPEGDKRKTLDPKDNAHLSGSEVLKLSNDTNSSSSTGNSNPPSTEGVNLSIFHKNEETHVEFRDTIDSNRVRSKSISNFKVNMSNMDEKDQNVPKLRFSMPATKTEYEEMKQGDHASFTDVSSSKKVDDDIPKLKEPDSDGETPMNLMSSVLEKKSILPSENVQQPTEVSLELTRSKKRLSSEMLGENEEVTSAKRRSTSAVEICEMVKEMVVREEDTSFDKKNEIIDIQEAPISAENILVGTCSNLQTSTCTNSTNELIEINENTPAQRSPLINENGSPDDRANIFPVDNVQESPNALKNTSQSAVINLDADSDLISNICNEVHTVKSPVANENCVHEIIAVEPTTGVPCARKSFAAASISSKSSLSDEISTKDRSIEIRSDNDSDRPSSQVHSTPFRKRSIKSIGGQSVLEDELIDSLNNPSIIVNIGDSFSHRSFDLCSESVSALEARDGSSGESGVKMNNVENVPSYNVSKVSFVSDWLQNKTGKGENKIINLFENQSSSSASTNKIISAEKSVISTVSSSGETKNTSENETEEEAENRKLNRNETLALEEKIINSDSCQVVERILPEDQPEDVENALEEAEKSDISLTVKPDITHIETEQLESNLLNENSKPAVKEMVSCEQNLLDLNHSRQPMTSELPLQQTVANIPELEEVVLSSVEPIREVSDSEQERMDHEIERTDRDEEINIDLMEVSADNIDSDEEECGGAMDAETTLNNTSVPETLKDENAMENLKKEILGKIREEFLSGNSEWRTKMVKSNEWIFQISEFGELSSALKTPPTIAVKLIPSLVIQIVPGSIDCSASFILVQSPPDNYSEIMAIAIRALRQRCQKKMKTICRTVENVPCLLKSLKDDLVWLMKFVNDLKRIGGCEDVRYKNGKASFFIASYKNLISFHVNVDLSSLKTLSIKDVKVKPHVGKIDTNCVLRVFSESGRDYDFFSRFIKTLINIFDS